MMTTEAFPPEPHRLSTLIESIAGVLRHGGVMTPGDLASLRRMDPRQPEAAFFKIEGLFLDSELPGDAPARAERETRWAAIIQGLAHLGRLHRRDERLGVALASGGFSELRFARLLRADAERLVDELPNLARYLAAKGMPADWTAAARLILSAGSAAEESVRRHLARDYYGALARLESH
jgi:CRISPR type I-E-associated protein CasB/Cse2